MVSLLDHQSLPMSLFFWKTSNPFLTAYIVDLSCAIVAHAWFKKYEPRTVSSCLAQLAVFAFAPVVNAVITLQSPWVNGPMHLALFIFTLIGSIVFYRVSPIHPLAKYPGPVICKVTKIRSAWVSHKGKLHLYYNDLHKKYGPIVRIGPNELSVIDVSLFPHILGQQGMPKGPLWDGRKIISHKQKSPSMSLISIRDNNIHAQLRKPWNRSFGPNAIQDYEESLVARGNELIEQLKELCRNSTDKVGHANISGYISRWSFDFMGDMAFGESFGLMRSGDKDGLVEQMKAANMLPAVTQMIPWAGSFLRSIPTFNQHAGRFSKFAVEQVQKRVAKVMGKKDLFYYLAASMDIDDDKPPLAMIISNVVLAIFAGSDTTSTVLAGIMYHLIRNPVYFQRLRKELDEAFPPSDNAVIKPDKLGNLELLNAIINEVLRLQPPLPTGMQRAPALGSGGKLLGESFIREGTAVTVPTYALHHNPHYFYPKPDEFWPERWFTQSDKIILNRAAFIPFSYGPANCVGKPLAISELRYITAMMVYNFDFWFEDGYSLEQWDRDLSDQFILVVGPLPVKLKQRVTF